ncbi:MAG: UDP-glucose 4-epimerase GalE [Victivallales bacterium]|nr:UDP-glucose 4-epimerase GalE [bacterium]MDD7752867.1 UDP-glucose 4-epimerase GalE [bacterium]MDY5697395.1 UDP-glucose 4-epimerase GalE [Victivallales bacterium]
MRVFVAGGAGYIGSACTEYLLDRGYEVTVFDDLITGHIEAVDPRAKFIKANLADRENLKKVVKEGNYDAIMHFAAFSLVGESMKNPSKYFNNNLANAINLADAAVEGGVKTFVFSSTAATFGEPKEIPIKEDAPQLPINPYGESKLCFEKVLNWYSKIYGLKYAALRYFNAAGATEKYGEDHNPETHLIPILLQVAQGKREKAMLFGDDYDTPDGTCIRDYIHILDLAQAHEKALYAPKSGHYNLGTGSGLSVMQILEAARKVTGHPIPAEVVPRRPGDPPRLIADSTRARQELGWKPQFENAEAIIASVWKWLQKHPNGYSK